jgi:hypothetical protein
MEEIYDDNFLNTGDNFIRYFKTLKEGMNGIIIILKSDANSILKTIHMKPPDKPKFSQHMIKYTAKMNFLAVLLATRTIISE